MSLRGQLYDEMQARCRERARQDEIAFREAFGDGRYIYHHEPDKVRFQKRYDGKVLWRGAHRFAHQMDRGESEDSNIRLLGALSQQHESMWGWCCRNISGREGYGKRSSWCRTGFQYIFRHREDAIMFNFRWGYFSFLSSSSSEA